MRLCVVKLGAPAGVPWPDCGQGDAPQCLWTNLPAAASTASLYYDDHTNSS